MCRYVLFPCLTVIVVTSLPSFETIHNIKIFEVEFSPSMTYTMKNWNLTIQWWMSNFVHRKLPFKNRNLRLEKFFCFLFITLILWGYNPKEVQVYNLLLEWPVFVTLYIKILTWFQGFLVSHISIFGFVSFMPNSLLGVVGQ